MSISISGTGGIANSAMELVGKTSWTTNTTSVTFNFDSTKYEQYWIYWWIDHNPSWLCTAARFRTAGADITTNTYAFGTEWLGTATAASSAGVVYNGSTGAASPNGSGGVAKSQIWLAGNGSDHDTHGFGHIIVPNSSSFYAGMRVNSTLIHRASGDAQTYSEKAWGAEYSTTSNNITGITIKAIDGGSSRRGMVSLVGLKKNPQN
jgi:hypothetical protein